MKRPVAPQDPWNAHVPGYQECRYCCANDRMEIVRRTTNMALLEQIVAWPDTQRTVRAAAESKVRRLAKEWMTGPMIAEHGVYKSRKAVPA